MTRRRTLLALPTLFLASLLAWSALGSFSSHAIGQEEPVRIERAHAGARAPSFKDPIFLLVLGGDARVEEGNPTRTRADSLHIVSIVPPDPADPEGRVRATVVGIPRDSYVAIPGYGRNKINAAGFFGGPELVLRAVEDLSGCRFDYYALTSFKGFIQFVNQIGGITFTVPSGGFVDTAAHANFRGGKQRFNGKEALAWSRARKSRPEGDISRSEAQGELLIAALAEARRDLAQNPGTVLRNIAAARRNLHLNIPLAESLPLALYAMRVAPRDVRNIVVDGALDMAGSMSIVRVTQEGLNQLADVCADGLLGG